MGMGEKLFAYPLRVLNVGRNGDSLVLNRPVAGDPGASATPGPPTCGQCASTRSSAFQQRALVLAAQCRQRRHLPGALSKPPGTRPGERAQRRKRYQDSANGPADHEHAGTNSAGSATQTMASIEKPAMVLEV
jgi:hypothetical protein